MLIAGLALLVVLLTGGAAFLFPLIPAQRAQVTITPISKRLTQITQVGVTEGEPGAGQTKGRAITYTTPVQTKSTLATGKGHQDPSQATGILVMSNASLDTPIGAGQHLKSNSGIDIVTDNSFSISRGQSTQVPAHAAITGPQGNIPAYDINGLYDVIDGRTHLKVGTVYVQNPAPFTGGSNARDYTFVQQTDIDGLANPLLTQLTPQAQQQAQQMLQPGEQLVSPIQCTSNVKSDHPDMAEATSVTVMVSVTCSGEAYNVQESQAVARTLYMNAARTMLGDGYALVGEVALGMPQTQTVDSQETAELAIKTDGVWAFQFSPTQRETIAQEIAGKPQRDALPLLRQTRGVRNVTISTSLWFGNALPSSSAQITIVIVNASGLQT